ncbi:glycosyltransferase [Hymenobacter sp. BT770]|uniref:glycosyltransferase family 2 protein n=1 Tax=Hymenobacter sp. BT770 TaxID=2886942 RepID=UPI001D10A537|nr:cellulose synthase catalytic subunit [Hymenobacter sp. BT770]MCC3152502.1 glycosyltransferase [Hymenobacter sp. BT770]MDO3414522.1 glycosyltransferase [Hymenobacter sp. BT770]
MRILVGFGLVAMAYFLFWFISFEHIGYAPLFWLLVVSLGFKMLRMLHEWVHYVQVQEPIAPVPAQVRLRTVDVLTTACPGEPHDMIVRTLEAMQALNYPHTSYLCDEGDDPLLRRECERLGVVHVTRAEKTNAKAGNINNALRQATGEFCVVLDPDHVMAPDFLDQVMPYFEDEKIGFVQVVQAYGNQEESLVARGAAEQTYHFYGPLMMGMNAYSTVQAIGANCTFRRAALDTIGGHAAGLTEDMHTAMRLHAEGWQSVYVPKVLSRGLVPSSLGAFYSQQLKWSRGAFDLMFRVYPRLWGRFTWAQRLHYFTLPLYFFSGVVTLIDILVPVASLALVEFPWYVSLKAFAQHMLPLWGIALLIRCYAQQWLREPHERGLHLAGGFLRIGTWWVYTMGFLYAVFRVRVPYIPTPKEEGWLRNEWRMALPNIATALVLLAACKYGRMQSLTIYTNLMVALSATLAIILLAASIMGQHEALRNFVRDMATWPFRPLVLGLNRLYDGLVRATAWRLRRAAVGLVTSIGTVGAIVQLLIYLDVIAPVPHLEWAKTGGMAVHVGVEAAGLEPPAATRVSTGQEKYKGKDIATFELGAGPMPLLPQDALQFLPAAQVPLVTWPVTGPAQSIVYWQNVARRFKQTTKRTVMLRPLFAANSAKEYRRKWRAMIRGFRAEQVSNVVWMWTPPRQEDLAIYCPGAPYFDWMVADHPEQEAGQGYEALRLQSAKQLDLHQKPVLLLTALPPNRLDLTILARRVARRYPEIKAVVYDTDTDAIGKTTLLQVRNLTTAPRLKVSTTTHALTRLPTKIARVFSPIKG